MKAKEHCGGCLCKLQPGTLFKRPAFSDVFILARVTDKHFTLINLTSGNRWDNPMTLSQLRSAIDANGFFSIAKGAY